MSARQLQTAVVFIVFNRPEMTMRSFASIRKARPSRLFIIADGPRSDVPQDIERCRSVRQIVENPDWPCSVSNIFSDENLGCMKRISSGLNYVFSIVSEAIIIEDDCLPDPSFFRYCEELLERYRFDERVGVVSGDNFQPLDWKTEHSYYFSRYPHCWGWASWRRAWERCDINMEQWASLRESKWLRHLFPDNKDRCYWEKMFDDTLAERIDSWAFRWTLSCWVNGMLTVLPAKNLVTNVGFDESGTNNLCKDSSASIPSHVLTFPLLHPASIVPDIKADMYTQRTIFRRSLLSNWINAIKNISSRKLFLWKAV